MASKEPRISIQTVAGTTRHITLTILETLGIIWKAYNTGLLTIYGIKKHKKQITCNNLGQYRYYMDIQKYFIFPTII